MPGRAAAWWSYLLAWSQVPPERHLRRITRELAWIARYAKGTSLTELLNLDRGWLIMFGEELAAIVEEENRSK